MSIATLGVRADGPGVEDDLGRSRRRAERRRLARRDAASARLAELHQIRALLDGAAVLVSAGWVQNAWFAVRGADGGEITLTAHEIHLADGREPSGACLVGGIVHAAGGRGSVHSQLVQRTLDLTWHALHEDPRQRVRWCPPPAVRAAHVRDLTRWNDHPRRTRDDVLALLRSADATAVAETRACLLARPVSA
jgi:hypothetical protein